MQQLNDSHAMLVREERVGRTGQANSLFVCLKALSHHEWHSKVHPRAIVKYLVLEVW